MEFCDDWTAIEDHMPPKEPDIRVGGTCRFPTTGWSAVLRPREGTPPFNPKMLMLELKVTAPSDGAADKIDDVAVAPYVREVLAGTECQYDEVNIVVVGVDEAPGLTLEVECVC